jgi:DNA invertase Pin-like site-specific DNA recombinase
MVIGVLASTAEFERELVKERTALKRERSRANGTRFGPRKKVADRSHIATARRMKADGHNAKDIAGYLGVSRATPSRFFGEVLAAWNCGPRSITVGKTKPSRQRRVAADDDEHNAVRCR